MQETIEHSYTDIALSLVVTRAEAAFLWQRSLTNIDLHRKKGNIRTRKGYTSGTLYLSVSSLIETYGLPKNPGLFNDFTGEITSVQFPSFDLFKGE